MKASPTRSAQALNELMAAPSAEQRRRLCALFERLSVHGRESVLTMAVCCADNDADHGRAAGPPTANATGPRIVRFPAGRRQTTRRRPPTPPVTARAALGNKLQVLALANPRALRIIEQMADDLLRATEHGRPAS